MANTLAGLSRARLFFVRHVLKRSSRPVDGFGVAEKSSPSGDWRSTRAIDFSPNGSAKPRRNGEIDEASLRRLARHYAALPVLIWKSKHVPPVITRSAATKSNQALVEGFWIASRSGHRARIRATNAMFRSIVRLTPGDAGI
jgi:hypothetical protein